MPARLVCFLSVAVLATNALFEPLAAQRSCAPVDSLWSHAPQRFAAPKAIPLAAGPHRFILVTTAGRALGGRASGTLQLQSPTQSVAADSADTSIIVLAGASDIDLRRVGSPSVAYPVSSRQADSAGVVVIYNGRDHTASLVLGNAPSDAVVRVDQGTVLWVLRADSLTVRGRWADASNSPTGPRGYFCIDRMQQR
jgi:hypothetical protein